jgi:predicted lactoylglutathione lyase
MDNTNSYIFTSGERLMAKQIFVNLPVKNLDKSVEFFTQLGFTFNPEFTNENATCMIVEENIFVMLLVEPFFKTFTPREICDAKTSTEVIIALSADSREGVDELTEKALAAGSTQTNEPQDYGWMYSRSFQDIDGHLWEVVYADMSNMPQG